MEKILTQPLISKSLIQQTALFQVKKSKISYQAKMSDYRTCTDFNKKTDIKKFNTTDCFISENGRTLKITP